MSVEVGEPARCGRHAGVALRVAVALVTAIAVLGVGAGPAAPSVAAPTAPVAPQGSCDTSTVLADDAGVDAIEADAQQDFLSRLNDLRRSRGLGALVWNEAMTEPAAAWSATMSRQIPPGGSASDPGWLHHARDTGSGDGVRPEQDYVNVNSQIVDNWQRLAENVGVGGMRSSCSLTELATNTDRAVVSLHDAFVASSGHFENMVGDFNQVGIGVHVDADQLWVTVRFAKGDLPTTSSVDPSVASYVDAAYELFTNRSSTTSEEKFWAPHVREGNRLQLTSSLAVTDAWSGVRVSDLYRKILGRSADGGGRAYWVDQIARGLRLEAVAAEFYGSAEYFWANGGTRRSYVDALYRDLLGRPADGAGLGYWVDRLRRGELTRTGVADNFYASIESRRDRVTRLHREVFGTAPTSDALDHWAERVAQVGDVRLAAELAASYAWWNMVVR